MRMLVPIAALLLVIAPGATRAQERREPTPPKPLEYVDANIPYYPPGRTWGTLGEPIRKLQLPLDPAESMKHMRVPPGFDVELFASEPDIVKPIAMAWDARGRLFIA